MARVSRFTLLWGAGLASALLFMLPANTGCQFLLFPPNRGGVDGCQTLPQTIDSDMVLRAGCYVAEKNVVITGGATLTIEPGVTIRFKKDSGMTVLRHGRLSAVGTAGSPIVFTGEQATSGFWNGLHFSDTNSSANKLEYVTIQYAGAYPFFGWEFARANLVLSGVGNSPTKISVKNCTLRDSAGFGFFINPNVDLTSFAGNTVTANTTGAGYTYASVLGSLDNTSSYNGNAIDIVRASGNSVETDQIWPAINADYEFVTSTTVHAVLTIEPGARLVFGQEVGFTVLRGGVLSAIGTGAKPIVFTGKLTVPGYWNGLYFSSSESPLNRLENVTLEYGGGYEFFGWDTARTNLVVKNSQLQVTSCKIQQSAGWGAWVGNDAAVNVDLETANTYAGNLAGNVYRQP